MYTSSQKSDGEGLDGNQNDQVAFAEVNKDFAWLTSHVHTYVLPFGGRQGSVDAFCTTCRERKEANIVALFEGKEKLWVDSFELFVEVQLSMAIKESVSKNVKNKWLGAKAQLGGGWGAVIAAGKRKGPETLDNVDLGYPRLPERMLHQVGDKNAFPTLFSIPVTDYSRTLSHGLTYPHIPSHTHPRTPTYPPTPYDHTINTP